MEPDIVIERTPGEKDAYAAGFAAGWRHALNACKRGLSPDDAERECDVTERLIRQSIGAGPPAADLEGR